MYHSPIIPLIIFFPPLNPYFHCHNIKHNITFLPLNNDDNNDNKNNDDDDYDNDDNNNDDGNEYYDDDD